MKRPTKKKVILLMMIVKILAMIEKQTKVKRVLQAR